MKRQPLYLALFLLFAAYTIPVQAQDTKPAAVAGEMDTNEDGKVDAAEAAAATAAEADVGDVVKDVSDVVGAAKGLGGKEGKATLIMVLLGAIFKLLLSATKLIKGQTKWFHAKKAKRIVKYTTLALGGLAALMANLVFGMGWLEAGIILLSGPMSVALHEYTKDSSDTPADA